MHDDDLLRRLAETAREEEDEEHGRLDPRWDALAAGTLPAAETEALQTEAGESTEGRMAYEAFTPLGDDFRSRMVETIRTQLPSASPALDAERAGAARPRPRTDRSRRLFWLGASAAAALAAAVLLLVLRPEPEPLPLYSAHLAGRTQELRSGEVETEPRGPQVFAAGNFFEMVLTPQQKVAGRLAVETFVAQHGEVSPWPAPFEVSEHGAVRIAGQVGEEIRLAPGESTLLVAVGRPGSLPGATELQDREGSGCRPFGASATVCSLPVILEEK